MAIIPERNMGSQGMKASAQGLGCMGMSTLYLDVDHKATEEESIRVIQRAKELGVTHLDTAIVYGMGHNESLVGPPVTSLCNPKTIAAHICITKGRFKATVPIMACGAVSGGEIVF
jgi:aryl-alcohol dehydrogenase-like predicted oxidoreductase